MHIYFRRASKALLGWCLSLWVGGPLRLGPVPGAWGEGHDAGPRAPPPCPPAGAVVPRESPPHGGRRRGRPLADASLRRAPSPCAGATSGRSAGHASVRLRPSASPWGAASPRSSISASSAQSSRAVGTSRPNSSPGAWSQPQLLLEPLCGNTGCRHHGEWRRPEGFLRAAGALKGTGTGAESGATRLSCTGARPEGEGEAVQHGLQGAEGWRRGGRSGCGKGVPGAPPSTCKARGHPANAARVWRGFRPPPAGLGGGDLTPPHPHPTLEASLPKLILRRQAGRPPRDGVGPAERRIARPRGRLRADAEAGRSHFGRRGPTGLARGGGRGSWGAFGGVSKPRVGAGRDLESSSPRCPWGSLVPARWRPRGPRGGSSPDAIISTRGRRCPRLWAAAAWGSLAVFNPGNTFSQEKPETFNKMSLEYYMLCWVTFMWVLLSAFSWFQHLKVQLWEHFWPTIKSQVYYICVVVGSVITYFLYF